MLALSDDVVRQCEDALGEYYEVEWTAPQSRFLQSTCTYPLFVGGFGSGKSTTMVGGMYRDLIAYPGANIAGYAPTYDLLTLITVPKLIEFLEATGLEYDHNKSRFTIEVEDHGMFILRSLDNPGRIVGYETFRAHVDEIDTISKDKAEMAWNKIIARNRQKIKLPEVNQWAKNRVCAYTTPEGYVFCYDRWVKNKKPQYEMYKAPTESNPHLPEDYIENLKATYPEQYIQAYLNGDFVNLTSSNVYKNFDRELNASDIYEPNEGEHLHIGMDFNVEKGAAVIHVIRDNVPHAIDEIHNSHDTDDTIRVIEDRYPDNPIHVYPDATGNKRSSSNSAPTSTDLAKLGDAGYQVHVDYANPRIRDRVNCWNAKILNGNGDREYFVNIENCPNLVETLEQQTWDDNGVPDKSTDLDHIGDAGGYFMCKVFPIARPYAGFGAKTRRRR